MLRGFYTAAAGMLAQQRHQATLANNLANAQTPGYKADQATMRAFPELLIERMEERNIPTSQGLNVPMQSRVGALNTGVYMQETIPDFAQGDLRETGVATDLALINGNLPDAQGSLFFQVQNEQGEARYTRNGNFTVDGQGYLVTHQGNYVLDQNGDTIQTGGVNFQVTEDGNLQMDGQAISLGIAYTNDVNQMAKEGNGLYRFDGDGQAPENARATEGVTFGVKQNFLEGSNVDPAKTMTEMMNTYRLFEVNQKVLKAYDQSMQKTVTEIGRVR